MKSHFHFQHPAVINRRSGKAKQKHMAKSGRFDQTNFQTNFNNQQQNTPGPSLFQVSNNKPNYMKAKYPPKKISNRPIRPQSPMQSSSPYNPNYSYSYQEEIQVPSKQNVYNPNYSKPRYQRPSISNPTHSATSNPNSLEAIKNYFVETFLSRPATQETSRAEDILLVPTQFKCQQVSD